MSTQINFKPVFPSPLGFANFGESNRELNKKLIRDIEHNMSVTEGKTKTFKKNQCSWQSYSGAPDMEPFLIESLTSIFQLLSKRYC